MPKSLVEGLSKKKLELNKTRVFLLNFLSIPRPDILGREISIVSSVFDSFNASDGVRDSESIGLAFVAVFGCLCCDLVCMVSEDLGTLHAEEISMAAEMCLNLIRFFWLVMIVAVCGNRFLRHFHGRI